MKVRQIVLYVQTVRRFHTGYYETQFEIEKLMRQWCCRCRSRRSTCRTRYTFIAWIKRKQCCFFSSSVYFALVTDITKRSNEHTSSSVHNDTQTQRQVELWFHTLYTRKYSIIMVRMCFELGSFSHFGSPFGCFHSVFVFFLNYLKIVSFHFISTASMM